VPLTSFSYQRSATTKPLIWKLKLLEARIAQLTNVELFVYALDQRGYVEVSRLSVVLGCIACSNFVTTEFERLIDKWTSVVIGLIKLGAGS
jgi:hypothetical protein